MALEIRHVSQGATGSTGQTNTIPASPTIISFPQPCTQIGIFNQSSSALLYVRYGGSTCTTSDFSLPPNSGYEWDGDAFTQVCVLGSAGGDLYSIIAH